MPRWLVYLSVAEAVWYLIGLCAAACVIAPLLEPCRVCAVMAEVGSAAGGRHSVVVPAPRRWADLPGGGVRSIIEPAGAVPGRSPHGACQQPRRRAQRHSAAICRPPAPAQPHSATAPVALSNCTDPATLSNCSSSTTTFSNCGGQRHSVAAATLSNCSRGPATFSSDCSDCASFRYVRAVQMAPQGEPANTASGATSPVFGLQENLRCARLPIRPDIKLRHHGNALRGITERH